MTTHSALLMLVTETPLHAGAGAAVSAIDLPIQREAHTGWPCVYGSSVKGALRIHASRHAAGEHNITDLFGPPPDSTPGENESHAGALLIGDAVLLALPVRSLQSHFKYVTCPAALQRFKRTLERLCLSGKDEVPDFPAAFSNENSEKPTALLAAGNGDLFLEEFCFTVKPDEKIAALAALLSRISAGGIEESTLKAQLCIVHDNIFAFLAEHATTVNAHIAINSETKTVRTGALWHEESLPPQTLLYIPVTATAVRRKGTNTQAGEVLQQFCKLFADARKWLQLGGNETTGMGWCHAAAWQASVQA